MVTRAPEASTRFPVLQRLSHLLFDGNRRVRNAPSHLLFDGNRRVRNAPSQTSQTVASILKDKLTHRILSKHSESVETRKDTDSDRRALLGTTVAGLALTIGLLPGLPDKLGETRAVTMPAAVFVALNVSKKATRESMKAKELKRLRRNEAHEKAKLDIETEYRPWDAPNLIKVGGQSRAVANVLNSDLYNLQVEAHGQSTYGTYHRFYFGVTHMSDHCNLYAWKDAVKQALGTQEAITLNWEEGKLCVDVSRPQAECTYPKVKEQVGNDLHQILIPKGMKGDRLLFVPFDSQFNGGWVTGMSGSGKSQWAIAALDFLRRRHSNKVIQYGMGEILDGNKTRAFYDADWADDPHLFAPLAQSYIDVIRSLYKIIQECRIRAKLFEQAGVQNVDEYNAQGHGEYLPRILYLLDEPETIFDPNVCPHLYKSILETMFLFIGRMARSQGAALIFLPKSVAAGDKDIFPTDLRRTMGSLAICLKATFGDGNITLQATEAEENYAGTVAHLPGRGAGLTRDNGDIVRIQGLWADKLDKSVIVGYGRDRQPDHTLPSFTKACLEFFHPNSRELTYALQTLPLDESLENALKDDDITLEQFTEILAGKMSLEQAKAGDQPKPKREKPEKPTEDPEALMALYRTYVKLRRTPKTSEPGSKCLSMTEAISRIAGTSNYNAIDYTSTVLAIEKAVERFGHAWIEQLDSNLNDEAITRIVFGRKSSQNDRNFAKRVAIIRKLRSDIRSLATAESN